MAHFYAEIKGGRGAATRCGDRQSGVHGFIRGWESGVHVTGESHSRRYDKATHDYDSFSVEFNGGSSGGRAYGGRVYYALDAQGDPIVKPSAHIMRQMPDDHFLCLMRDNPELCARFRTLLFVHLSDVGVAETEE